MNYLYITLYMNNAFSDIMAMWTYIYIYVIIQGSDIKGHANKAGEGGV